MVRGGQIYTTGNNQNYMAGPLVGTNSAINGPILTYSGTDIVTVTCFGDDATLAIITGGQVRMAGEAGQYSRPDNITTDQKGTTGQPNEAFSILTGAGSGWTFLIAGKTGSNTNWGAGIKNGEAYIGGAFSQGLNAVMGNTQSSTWKRIGTTSNFVCIEISGANFGEMHAAFSTS